MESNINDGGNKRLQRDIAESIWLLQLVITPPIEIGKVV